jgi:hypothetical protein
MIILGIIKHSMMITSFVLMMMLFIEYINIKTKGNWQKNIQKNKFGQYLLSAILGVMPGCLGAFAVVSLYSHRVVSFGALVGTMIATSGDEAFVMFSMFPLDAFKINIIVFILAIIVAFVVDLIFKNKHLIEIDHEFEIHKQKEHNHCFPKNNIIHQLKHMIFPRALLLTLFSIFILALSVGVLGGEVWNWKKIIFILGSLGSIFIIATVSDHFLNDHIYNHIIKKHLLRIFLWTFGALLVVHLLENYLDIASWIQNNPFGILTLATIIGIIPESGPHMIFVTMYAKELVPFAVLLASSISQDGHGTLPLLAVSRKVFIYLKIINVIVAFVVGFVLIQFNIF